MSGVQQVDMEWVGSHKAPPRLRPLPRHSHNHPFPAERAERHDAQEILQIARDLVHKVQMLIENK